HSSVPFLGEPVMTCKLCGVALLIGAVALGAFGYVHHTGCCPLTGAPIEKNTGKPNPASPGENTNAPEANFGKKDGGCPHCCGDQKKEDDKGFFTGLAEKTGQDEGGCCDGKCSEGKGCCQDKGNTKSETPVKK